MFQRVLPSCFWSCSFMGLLCVQYEVVFALEAWSGRSSNICSDLSGHQAIGLVVVDLLVRKRVDDVRDVVRVLDADLAEHIPELPSPRNEATFSRTCRSKCEVICAQIVGLSALVPTLEATAGGRGARRPCPSPSDNHPILSLRMQILSRVSRTSAACSPFAQPSLKIEKSPT